MAEVTEKQMSNRIKLIIAGVVIFVIAVIAILIAWIINIPKTATIEVIVAPSDAKILIGEKRYKNGTHKIEPGDYSIAVTRDDFSPYASEFSIKEGETKKLLVCLNEIDGNTWYDEHKEDDDICRRAAELASEEYKKEKQTADIYSVTPYNSYDDGFNIVAYEDEEKGTIVKITLLSCKEARREALKPNALEWLKKHNVDPEQYTIEYANGCQ
jgi:hypothetical protein